MKRVEKSMANMAEVKKTNSKKIINASGMRYRELNQKIRELTAGFGDKDISEIVVENVLGQRYIGDGLKKELAISINGTPGNDLGAFMNGPIVEVFGNGQDGIGNTMNSGKIIIHGDAGDILGYSMRGGEIYIEKNAGWRCGIHMKSYRDKIPVIVIGGSAGNFLGEYMAGGIVIVLGLHDRKLSYYPHENDSKIVGDHVGTGMHGGTIYIRGDLSDCKVGKEVRMDELNKDDFYILEKFIKSYCNFFNIDCEKILKDHFIKLTPYSHRPYGKLYSY